MCTVTGLLPATAAGLLEMLSRRFVRCMAFSDEFCRGSCSFFRVHKCAAMQLVWCTPLYKPVSIIIILLSLHFSWVNCCFHVAVHRSTAAPPICHYAPDVQLCNSAATASTHHWKGRPDRARAAYRLRRCYRKKVSGCLQIVLGHYWPMSPLVLGPLQRPCTP